MNRFVLLLLLVVFTASSKHAEGKSFRLDKVVRALDALYRRTGGGPTPTAAPEPTDPEPTDPEPTDPEPTSDGTSAYESGSASGESGSGSGSDEKGGRCDRHAEGLYWMLRNMKDEMFVSHIREAVGGYLGLCHSLKNWLEEHLPEKERARESEGLDSLPKGSAPPPTGGYSVKKSSNLSQVKRSLRSMKLQLDARGGGRDSGNDDGMEVEDLGDDDVPWHRVFIACYVFLS